MAHTVIDDKVVVDWVTGDMEGDRVHLLSAYHDFVNRVIELTKIEGSERIYGTDKLEQIIKEWGVSTENQVDGISRIWIKRPS